MGLGHLQGHQQAATPRPSPTPTPSPSWTGPPVKIACPANLNVQGYVQMAKVGKDLKKVPVHHHGGPAPCPGTIGRICPHPCEGECRRLEVDEAIAIRDIKRYVADSAGIEPTLPSPRWKSLGARRWQSWAPAPAGLACAYHLARAGHQVALSTMLCPWPAARWPPGVPEYRLPREGLQREVDLIKSMGVEIKLNSPIGGGPAL